MVKRLFNFYHREKLKEQAKEMFGPEFTVRVEEYLRTPEFQEKINKMFGYPIGYDMDKTSPNGGNA